MNEKSKKEMGFEDAVAELISLVDQADAGTINAKEGYEKTKKILSAFPSHEATYLTGMQGGYMVSNTVKQHEIQLAVITSAIEDAISLGPKPEELGAFTLGFCRGVDANIEHMNDEVVDFLIKLRYKVHLATMKEPELKC